MLQGGEIEEHEKERIEKQEKHLLSKRVVIWEMSDAEILQPDIQWQAREG